MGAGVLTYGFENFEHGVLLLLYEEEVYHISKIYSTQMNHLSSDGVNFPQLDNHVTWVAIV